MSDDKSVKKDFSVPIFFDNNPEGNIAGIIEITSGGLVATFSNPISEEALFDSLGNISFLMLEVVMDETKGKLFKRIRIMNWSVESRLAYAQT